MSGSSRQRYLASEGRATALGRFWNRAKNDKGLAFANPLFCLVARRKRGQIYFPPRHGQ